MKYIDADKLKAEINERLMAVNLEKLGNFGSHRVWAYNDVKDIIDSLQQEQPEVDLNGKVTFDNKTILRVETDEKKKRVLEIIGLEESCCNYPLNYENETDDCFFYYEEYNDRIYIDGNITFNQMREIVEYIENK